MKKRVMVIDDEEMLLELVKGVLQAEYEVETFDDPAKAIDRICIKPEGLERPDLILTDLDLGKGYTGIGIIRVAREFWYNIPAAIMSGGFKAASEVECLRETQNIIHKPFKIEELVDFVKNTLDAVPAS